MKRIHDNATLSHQIVLLDADEQFNRVRVGMTTGGSETALQQLLKTLDVPISAVLIERAPAAPRPVAYVYDRFRPSMGAGIRTSVGGFKCSMGFHVTDSVGTKYFLTAGHCGGNYIGGVGTNFYQSAFVSSDLTGFLAINPPWNTTGCGLGATYCALVDVALVQFDSAQFFSKRVAQTAAVGTANYWGSANIATWYSVAAGGDAASGDTVFRTGTTTGSTKGPVIGTCVSAVYVSLLEMQCQTRVKATVSGGDSGGPVYHFRFPLSSSFRQADGVVSSEYVDASGNNNFFYSSWGPITSWLGRSLNAN